MSTVYQWAVANLERSVADGMVQTVHYTINASDGTYASSAYGSIGLDAADPEAMVPYAELTPELCIDWVKEKLGGEEKVTEIEAALQAQIDEQRQPSKAAGVPWG
jgi:hypothetical protein